MYRPPRIEPDEHMAAHDGRFLAAAQPGAWEFLHVAQGGGVEEKDRDGEEEPRGSSEQKASPGWHGLLALRWQPSLGEPYQRETGGGGGQKQGQFGRCLVRGGPRRLFGEEGEKQGAEKQTGPARLARGRP